MYKSLITNDFRQFNNMEISLGKRLTAIAGRNSTGKSTILGILANSGELKKKDGTTYANGQFRAEFSEILHGSKRFDASGSDRIQIDIVDDKGNQIDYRKFRTAWQNDNGKDRFRVIHDNRKYMERAFYCMRNTGFWVGIVIPAFLIQRHFPFIAVSFFQQRTRCAYCESYFIASDRQ